MWIYMGNSSCLCNSCSNFGLTTGEPYYELKYSWKEGIDSFFVTLAATTAQLFLRYGCVHVCTQAN